MSTVRAAMRRIAEVGIGFVLPAAILIVWWGLTRESRSPFWPPLTKIFSDFKKYWLFTDVRRELEPSMIRFAEGYVIAIGIGLVVGIGCGLVPFVRKALEPLLDFARVLPAVALLVPVILLLGPGDRSKVALIVFFSVWAILFNAMDGVRGIDEELHDLSKAYRLRGRDRLFQVVMPAAAPQIFAGLRIALAHALLGMVITEMFLASNGIGHFLVLTQASFEVSATWTGIFVIMIVAFVVNMIFEIFERRVLWWHHASHRSAFTKGSET